MNLDHPAWGTATLLEVAWTLLNGAAMIYVLRNLFWLLRFTHYARRHSHNPDAIREARGYTWEETGRLVVSILFTSVGVAAMLTPQPIHARADLLQVAEAALFLVAAVVYLVNSYLTHRRLES